MFSLVEKFVECHVEGQRVEKESVWFLNHSYRTIAKIVNMNIKNVNGRSWFRNSDHTKSMIRLTM